MSIESPPPLSPHPPMTPLHPTSHHPYLHTSHNCYTLCSLHTQAPL
jgi:hypothetical protein